MQAWPLLNQIWEHKLAAAGGNSEVYANIGAILAESGGKADIKHVFDIN